MAATVSLVGFIQNVIRHGSDSLDPKPGGLKAG